MEKVRLRDFRCFAGRHEAQLAPLTLLVGENSTGKTSLMAMIRALWEVAYRHSVPNFKEEPFDLGSFEDMVHRSATNQAKSFSGGFTDKWPLQRHKPDGSFSFDATFRRLGTAPMPTIRRVSDDECTFVVAHQPRPGGPIKAQVSVCSDSSREDWEVKLDDRWSFSDESLTPLFYLTVGTEPTSGKQPSDHAKRRFEGLVHFTLGPIAEEGFRPFASAPVRSRPKRTYDPRRPARDPEGDYIPTYLAEVHSQGGTKWNNLLERLEEFGTRSKLFDALRIQPKGDLDGDPFQVHVKHTSHDPWRNLMDMGYGLSQVLPLITELSRPDSLPISLVQQPEVHLHPNAQAALGSLFCQMAEEDHQLIVETHSDHMVNRIRMDVRDGSTGLKADDVSILYFERYGTGAKIHSLRLDEQGNIDAPPSYSKFFMEELNRQLHI